MSWQNEKAQLLLSLMQVAEKRESLRREFEWKIFFGIWTALGAMASVIATAKWFPKNVLIPFLLAGFGAGVYWVSWRLVKWIQTSNTRDRREQYYWLSGIEEMTGIRLPEDFRPPFPVPESCDELNTFLNSRLAKSWPRIPRDLITNWLKDKQLAAVPFVTQLADSIPLPQPGKGIRHAAPSAQLALTLVLVALIVGIATARFLRSTPCGPTGCFALLNSTGFLIPAVITQAAMAYRPDARDELAAAALFLLCP